MSAIVGLSLPLRGKISTKTDEPDGIELGGKENEENVVIIWFGFCFCCSSAQHGTSGYDGFLLFADRFFVFYE